MLEPTCCGGCVIPDPLGSMEETLLEPFGTLLGHLGSEDCTFLDPLLGCVCDVLLAQFVL